VLAGRVADAGDVAEEDPAEAGVADDVPAGEDPVGVVPLGDADEEPFVVVELSGGGRGGGLAVCADAKTGATEPARTPNVRKKRE